MIQNLGPGNVFFDAGSVAAVNSGLKLLPGAVYEFPVPVAAESLSLIADQAATDVRVIMVGD